MAADAQVISWSFGGALAGQPASVAWPILGGVAVAGLAFVWWSYTRALVAVTPRRRVVLCVLRTLPWLGLLLILAAPTRIQRSYEQPPGARPLAVLVDQSGSMTAADNRQRRRLDDALRRWHDMAPVARKAHSEVKTFAFATEVQPAGLDDRPAKTGADQTKLFAALQKMLADAPAGGWGGIVTLTDGLDTSGTEASAGVEKTVRAALAQSAGLYFVPGRNRYAGKPFFGLRDFKVPAHTAPHATFHVEATFDSYQAAARSVDVQFKVNGAARPATTMRLEPGRRLTVWSTDLPAGDPGVIELELRVESELARAAVRVERPASNRILYFQGALDWSYRFLADILKREPTFVLTPVFNFPNPNAALPPGALRRMPEIPKELDGFDVVILANAAASQFTAAQQAALSSWVRDGGVVLFFTPDDDSTQGFSGSELEKMLPVLFAPPQPRAPASAFRMLSSLRGGYGAAEGTKLTAFEWEKSPRVREIFAEAEKSKVALVAPLFSEYAHVAQAKPGADVLARHPTEVTSDGSERNILLAVQRYGRGQSAVLTTDALWRWKLNQPAGDRSAEVFWQTLFAWLTREHQSGLRFDEAPRVAELGREVTLRVLGATPENLRLDATLAAQHAALTEGTADGKARVFRFTPPGEGLWQVTANDAGGVEVKHWITVRKSANSGELSGAAPDEELLRTLATRTGGAVLENGPSPAWQETRHAQGVLLGEKRELLWHRPWLFGMILGLYGAELLLRRKWRML